jgi:hypothetical protein
MHVFLSSDLSALNLAEMTNELQCSTPVWKLAKMRYVPDCPRSANGKRLIWVQPLDGPVTAYMFRVRLINQAVCLPIGSSHANVPSKGVFGAVL